MNLLALLLVRNKDNAISVPASHFDFALEQIGGADDSAIAIYINTKTCWVEHGCLVHEFTAGEWKTLVVIAQKLGLEDTGDSTFEYRGKKSLQAISFWLALEGMDHHPGLQRIIEIPPNTGRARL